MATTIIPAVVPSGLAEREEGRPVEAGREAVDPAVEAKLGEMRETTGTALGVAGGVEQNREADPRLAAYKSQFEALPVEARTCGGKERSWEEVMGALVDSAVLLAEAESLSSPLVYFLREDGYLVIGDGEPEPRWDSVGDSYTNARAKNTKVVYRTPEGRLMAGPGDVDGLEESAVVTRRGLVKGGEYERLHEVYPGKFEQSMRYAIWLESGQNPKKANEGVWNGQKVVVVQDEVFEKSNYRGARVVVRAKLNFGA